MPGVNHAVTTDSTSYIGTNDADTLSASGNADTLNGAGGDDQLGASQSHTGSVLIGGDGADSITAGYSDSAIYGNAGNDQITIGGFGNGTTIYGGQGDDSISATFGDDVYISGDLGNDLIFTGNSDSSGGTVLGGSGNDSISASHSMAFGNMGEDFLGVGFHATAFGGQGSDTVSGSGGGNMLSGDLGDDTVVSSGGGDLMFGGQGNDYMQIDMGGATAYGGQGDDYVVVNDNLTTGGHDLIHGDLGNDTIMSSSGGGDTIFGGVGADSITLVTHDPNAPNYLVVGATDSTADTTSMPGIGGEANLDHIAGIDFTSDRIIIVGHSAGNAMNVTRYQDATANSSESAAFQSAYLYAYGDGTSTHPEHVGDTEYLAVSETYDGVTSIYVFTANHTAVAFTNVDAQSFQPTVIAGG